MNLIGPKSIASKLHLAVKVLFFFAIARVLLMAVAPVLPFDWRRYLSFDVVSGPLQVSFNMLQGTEARWGIWAMELVSRTCHAVVVYLLMKILAPVAAGESFHTRTPSRLRMMGCVVVIGSLLRTIFCVALLKWGMTLGPGARISWAIDFDAVFMGFLLVVLSDVFRRGYALRTESELTV